MIDKKTLSIWERQGRIGFIGLGNMGSAIAMRLTKPKIDGLPLMVYDPDSIKLAPFIEKGAIAAKSALELCKSCDIIFACLPTSAVTETVLFGDAGISQRFKTRTDFC